MMSEYEYLEVTARRIGQWLGNSRLFTFVRELSDDRDLLKQIEAAVADEPFFRTKSWFSPISLGVYRCTLYCLTRLKMPALVVETGVLHGLTSRFILRALEKNGDGKLISIDLPSYHDTGPSNQDGYNDTLPPMREPGWIVRDKDALSRWQLVYGSTAEELPSIIASNHQIEIFIHDSEHTYQTMSFELNSVWPRLALGGIVVCDNIDSNTAFFDFCLDVDRRPLVVSDTDGGRIRFGMIIK
jgi:predicted O-methyltransferase YrrM